MFLILSRYADVVAGSSQLIHIVNDNKTVEKHSNGKDLLPIDE